MKRIAISILFVLTLMSCSRKIKVDKDFFEGEWISDSIFTKENDHWREFLFFDSLGVFNRTTLWGQDYILSRNFTLKDSTILNNNQEVFKISVIDSFEIILKATNYYGRFYRDRWPTIGSYTKDLNDILKADENRKILLGNWLLVDNITNKIKGNKFLDQDISDKLELRISVDHFSVQSDSNSIDYSYIVNPTKIEVRKQDYIIPLQYTIHSDTLLIENEPTYGIENHLKFIKAK